MVKASTELFIWNLLKISRRKTKFGNFISVYGLDDAARSWFLEVEKLKEFRCIQSKVDPCMFYFYKENQFIGLVFLYVDDFLHMGNKVFEEEVIQKVKLVYHIGKSEEGSFSYTG